MPRPAPPPRLVLVVDQFEELFTAGGDADADREAFIAALHAAATARPARSTSRRRWWSPRCARTSWAGSSRYPALKAALEAGPFTVGPMSEAELRLAMTGPAAEAGLAVEPALVEAVIAELREGARRRAGQRGAAADVAGDGRHLAAPRGE